MEAKKGRNFNLNTIIMLTEYFSNLWFSKVCRKKVISKSGGYEGEVGQGSGFGSVLQGFPVSHQPPPIDNHFSKCKDCFEKFPIEC